MGFYTCVIGFSTFSIRFSRPAPGSVCYFFPGQLLEVYVIFFSSDFHIFLIWFSENLCNLYVNLYGFLHIFLNILSLSGNFPLFQSLLKT